jgi:thioredoxin-like negative regulator of GroEL
METIDNLKEFEDLVRDNRGAAFYFTGSRCGACQSLKPKVEQMFIRDYPAIKLREVDILESPEVGAQNNVLTVPALVVYFEGRETFRTARFIDLDELSEQIDRWYEELLT